MPFPNALDLVVRFGRHLLTLAICLACLASVRPVLAQQEVAKVDAIVRVVKTAPPGGNQFTNAKLGSALPAGGRLRTGGRSKAGLRFTNKSTLRLDELTEVVVSGARQTDVRVLGGRILADYTRPGTVTGGYATAAVRGTKVIYFENAKKKAAYVRCYGGIVYVGPPNVALRAGTAASGTAATLVDPDLVGETRFSQGQAVRFLSGPLSGKQSLITGFDAESGTVTFDPAVDPAVAQGTAYLLVSDPAAKLTELGKNQGVTVENGIAGLAYGISGLEFAEGQRNPWHTEITPGVVTSTYPASLGHQDLQIRERPVETATQVALDDPNPGSTATLLGSGSLVVIVDPEASTSAASFRNLRMQRELSAFSGRPNPPLMTSGSPLSAAAGQLVFGATGGEDREASLPRREGDDQRQPNSGKGVTFQALPFAVGASNGYAAGLELRAQAILGPVLTAVAGRYATYDGDTKLHLSEGVAHLRTGAGELLVGRQHFFLGPVNNSDLGKLLGFDTIDAAIVRTSRQKRYRQEFGYILDTSPLFGGGYSSWYTRGEATLGRGIFGWQLLTANVGGAGLGWSLDASYPLIRDLVDVYAEGGMDPLHNRAIAAGFYLPGIYQRTNFDVFAEYGEREGLAEFVQLRIRRRFARSLFVTAFVRQGLRGEGLDGGGGIQYTHTFR